MTGIKPYLYLLILCWTTSSFAQKIVRDTLAPEANRKFSFHLDLASRYLWRGQSWGGDYAVVQPAIDYQLTDRLSVGFWATTNFESRYFYTDQLTGPRGYQEIDFNLKYQFNSWLSVELWDYYWPTVSKVAGVDNSFFHYGPNSVKTVDAMLLVDLMHWQVPISLTLSTLVAGCDYRYDALGEHPKQNYTTYLEAMYSRDFGAELLHLDAALGAVFNNQAQYYTAGDYDRVSWVNLSLKASHEWTLGQHWSFPLWINYVHNAARNNTEAFGRNFWIAGMTLNYQ